MSAVRALAIAVIAALVSFAAANNYNGQSCETLYQRRWSPWSGDCQVWKDWKCSQWYKDGPSNCNWTPSPPPPAPWQPAAPSPGAADTCESLYLRRFSPKDTDCNNWNSWQCSTWYTWADSRPKGCAAWGGNPPPPPPPTTTETCETLKNRRWSPWAGDCDKWKNWKCDSWFWGQGPSNCKW